MAHPTPQKKVDDMVYDLDSGEMLTKEEYAKRQSARQMQEIGEDEEEDEDEDEDEEDEEDEEEEGEDQQNQY